MRILLIETATNTVTGHISGLTQQEVQTNNPTLLALEDTFGIDHNTGMTYDSVTNSLTGTPTPIPEYVPPPPPPAPVELRHITQLAFMTRFTDAEAIALDLASIGATVAAASMRRYLDKLKVAKYIDLDRADTRSGVQTLEVIGLIAAGRALEILDNPIAPEERA